MNILYEENGSFKVGNIMVDNTTSLQIESLSGKRSKIKSNNVMLRFQQPEMAEFIPQAEALAADIDAEFLWECCPEEEFQFAQIAEEYFGHTPSPTEAAAILFCLHNAPIYFHKKGKGKYRAAPPEILKAALAGLERKRQQEELQQHYIEQLTAFQLPEAFGEHIHQLLYKPQKNSAETKALEAACSATGLSGTQLLHRCGAIPSAHDYHLHKFLFEHFPKGTGFPETSLDDWETLPDANINAFSIDDANTTEIDDAFSVVRMDNGNWQIGVHIAAPALGISRNSSSDQLGAQRLSTVYMPGNKITMLPDSIVDVFTLSADRRAPALSMYLQIDAESFEIIDHSSQLNQIHIADNLRHETLEPLFNQQAIAQQQWDYPYGQELQVLWQFALKLEEQRGKSSDNNNQQVDYSFHIDEDGTVHIGQRQRGTPIDKVVSELMILVNSLWGKQLADHEVVGIYRSQQNGKVRMSTNAAPHQGLGVAQYMWSSSPLRRYVDLVNQRQLIALLQQQTAPYSKNDPLLFAAIRDFEVTYSVYKDFQRNMERYWCLRWLQQQQLEQINANVIREGLVRVEGIPLVIRVPSLPAEVTAGKRIQLQITAIDELELELKTRYQGELPEAEAC